MRRIRLTVAYDGTNYCGFQLQPNQPTIEGELNRALSELTHEEVHVIGASRTDSGVHAYGNVAVFDTHSSIPADRFPMAIACFLPQDIKVTEGEEVPLDWHPRKYDCVKTYEYVYDCGRIEDPKQRLYASFSTRVPDIRLMQEAARYLIGEHDFTSFANPSSQVLKEGGSAVRTIYSIDIFSNNANASYASNCRTSQEPDELKSEHNDILPPTGVNSIKDISAGKYTADSLHPPHNMTVTIRITGNGFLYNMVRIIAGTLINVGTGLWTAERVAAALAAHDRTKAGPTAEARGLTLMSIRYN